MGEEFVKIEGLGPGGPGRGGGGGEGGGQLGSH